MIRALVLLSLLTPTIAFAQFGGPLMKNNGAQVVPAAPFWNFVGVLPADVVCAYDAATASDKCTFNGAGPGGVLPVTTFDGQLLMSSGGIWTAQPTVTGTTTVHSPSFLDINGIDRANSTLLIGTGCNGGCTGASQINIGAPAGSSELEIDAVVKGDFTFDLGGAHTLQCESENNNTNRGINGNPLSVHSGIGGDGDVTINGGTGALLTISAGGGGAGAVGKSGGIGGGLTLLSGAGGTANGGTGAIAGPVILDTGSTAAGTPPAVNICGTSCGSVNYGNGSIVHTFTGASAALGSALTATFASGTLTKYDNETTAGTGVPYIEAIGLDVASAGGGAQSTTVATYTPPNAAGGYYRVAMVVSCSVSDASISMQITFTDKIDSHATALTPISAFACTAGANTDTTSASVIVRANNGSAIVAKISASAQATTKASATIERLQ